MNSAQQLPPKMAQQYADKAKAGQANRTFGMEPGPYTYEFDVKGSKNKVVLMSLDPPMGYVAKGGS